MMEARVSPSGVASPRTLIRRASIILTGLAPTDEEAAAFEEAARRGQVGAYEALVDRLLASPRFGERFARHWLDVVRFSETHGNEWNYDVPYAWRYRDYVIRAFNEDVPYDQFVREHIAGDLLPRPRRNEPGRFNESAIGTAFYRFGEVNHDSCIEFGTIGYDIADNQLDTLTKAFQATTVACARCHDHKMDAVSTRDYHALLGILRSSRSVMHTLDQPEVNREPIAELKRIKADVRAQLAAVWRGRGGLDRRPEARGPARRVHRGFAPARQPGSRLGRRGPRKGERRGHRRGLDPPGRGAGGGDPRPGRVQPRPVPDSRRLPHPDRARLDHDRHGIAGRDRPERRFRRGPGGRVRDQGGAPRRPVHLRRVGQAQRCRAVADFGAPGGRVSFEIIGGGSSLARLVFNNCQINYNNQHGLHHNDWTWVTVHFPDKTAELHPYAELLTFWDSPKFPDPLGTLGQDTENQRQPWAVHAKNPRTWWGVRRVVTHDAAETPKEDIAYLSRLLSGPPPKDVDDLASRYARVASGAVDAFAADRATDDDVRWLDWLLRSGLVSNRADASPRLAARLARYREVERGLSLPRTMPGLADEGAAFDQPILVRGDFTRPGERVERRFLRALDADDSGRSQPTDGSGRAEVAERIADPTNPLTARVMVNRVWQWVFGRGLVRTPDDFGHMGEAPSHPELLDFLAARFVDEGWSVKRLVPRAGADPGLPVGGRPVRRRPRAGPR